LRARRIADGSLEILLRYGIARIRFAVVATAITRVTRLD